MNILYDGAERIDEQIVTFSEVPNILTVQENIYGDNAVITFVISDDWQASVTSNTQYSITLFGETISNVMSPSQAKNKKFYVGSTAADTAFSIARALRNCSSVAADFTINTGTTNSPSDSVVIKAKTIGRKFTSEYLVRNVPQSLMNVVVEDGYADEDDDMFINSKIGIDVYKDDEYVTSLEKNYYNDECSFDLTPVLATMTEPNGENNEALVPYTLVITKLAEDGTYSNLDTLSGYTTYGYTVDDSQKYLPLETMLLNSYNLENDRMLYTYFNKINYSMLVTHNYTLSVKIYDNTFTSIYNTTISSSGTSLNPLIKDFEFVIPDEYYNNAYAVDITDDFNTFRFYLIKPLKATEEVRRILWRNEYGGISFFDFTGQMSETDSISIETYEKNIFDYYSTNAYEKEKIYSSELKKSVKLKTHLMKKDGKYIFDSLAKSKKIWTIINGVTRFIIPKTIEISEDGNYNDIFAVTFGYEYSDLS